MTLVLVVVGIVFALGLIATLIEQDFEMLGGVIILSVVVGIFALLLVMMLGVFAPKVTLANEPIMLNNLYNDPSVQGSFFLGSGTIDEEQYVFYSYRDEEEALVYRKWPMESVRIFDDNPERPYLQTYRDELKYPWMEKVTLSLLLEQKDFEFHIPQDAIDRNFSVK